jgi:hypothetical protein
MWAMNAGIRAETAGEAGKYKSGNRRTIPQFNKSAQVKRACCVSISVNVAFLNTATGRFDWSLFLDTSDGKGKTLRCSGASLLARKMAHVLRAHLYLRILLFLQGQV